LQKPILLSKTNELTPKIIKNIYQNVIINNLNVCTLMQNRK